MSTQYGAVQVFHGVVMAGGMSVAGSSCRACATRRAYVPGGQLGCVCTANQSGGTRRTVRARAAHRHGAKHAALDRGAVGHARAGGVDVQGHVVPAPAKHRGAVLHQVARPAGHRVHHLEVEVLAAAKSVKTTFSIESVARRERDSAMRPRVRVESNVHVEGEEQARAPEPVGLPGGVGQHVGQAAALPERRVPGGVPPERLLDAERRACGWHSSAHCRRGECRCGAAA